MERDSVIFVDWHQVLCTDMFWSSILSNRQHWLHRQLQFACGQLFEKQIDRVQSWMRGELSETDIVASLDIAAGEHQYLLDVLHNDCRDMRYNEVLARELGKARSHCYVVVATDNMDCFAKEFWHLPGVSSWVDELICSSDMKLLKADSVKDFFGPWLQKHKLRFTDSVLLDDSQAICRQFEQQGGTAIQVGLIEESVDWLRGWLDHRNSSWAFSTTELTSSN